MAMRELPASGQVGWRQCQRMQASWDVEMAWNSCFFQGSACNQLPNWEGWRSMNIHRTEIPPMVSIRQLFSFRRSTWNRFFTFLHWKNLEELKVAWPAVRPSLGSDLRTVMDSPSMAFLVGPMSLMPFAFELKRRNEANTETDSTPLNTFKHRQISEARVVFPWLSWQGGKCRGPSVRPATLMS